MAPTALLKGIGDSLRVRMCNKAYNALPFSGDTAPVALFHMLLFGDARRCWMSCYPLQYAKCMGQYATCRDDPSMCESRTRDLKATACRL